MLQNNQYNILFLCTGNSARSIMAEALLRHCGDDKLNAFSAGSQPKDQPHLKTIEVLHKNKLNSANFRSKSWNEFSRANSPKIDIVITVCSNAANETCPIFPGTPISLHWDINDPAHNFDSDEKQTREFQTVFNELKQRIQKLSEELDNANDKTALRVRLKKLSD